MSFEQTRKLIIKGELDWADFARWFEERYGWQPPRLDLALSIYLEESSRNDATPTLPRRI